MLFNEPKLLKFDRKAEFAAQSRSFSALQRAEIAEIQRTVARVRRYVSVSVLFNEPKLLKYQKATGRLRPRPRFSALQRAEIAEIIVET